MGGPLPADAGFEVGPWRGVRRWAEPVDCQALPDRSDKGVAEPVELVGLNLGDMALVTLRFGSSDVQAVAMSPA